MKASFLPTKKRVYMTTMLESPRRIDGGIKGSGGRLCSRLESTKLTESIIAHKTNFFVFVIFSSPHS
jgi:hypothetical protein